MTDDELDQLYKSGLPTSHANGLRLVYQQGLADQAAADAPQPPAEEDE